MASHDEHKLPLWGLFLALLALTAAEVGLYETWARVETLHNAIPKYGLVLIIMLFTLPKAMIVLIYFMHLKFEKQFVIALALAPFLFAAIAVLVPLTDAVAVRDRAFNHATYHNPPDHEGAEGHGEGAHEPTEEKKPEKDPNDPFSFAAPADANPVT